MENHHATLLFASSLEDAPLPQTFKIQSADVLHFKASRFSIDDARELSQKAGQRSFGTGQRIFVIVADTIATEAQNALLKILEEPPASARFFIVLKQTAHLLPTLRSRLNVEQSTTQSGTNTSFASFASLSFGERLELIALKTKEKDTLWIEEVLHGFERWAETAEEKERALKTALFIRKHIHQKGASAKMLLEELALTLPLL